jgi:hypothetical protein
MRPCIVVLLVAAGAADLALANNSDSECTSPYAGDSKVELCGSFCSSTNKAMHCKRCQCKSCSFCSSLTEKVGKSLPAPTSTGASSGHQHRSKTTSKATTEHPAIKLSGTSSTTPVSGDRFDHYCATESCEKWCNREHAHHHCNDCRCKGCQWCSSYKCERPACEKWCDVAYKKYHCNKCPCKTCKFCIKRPPLPPPPPPPPPPPRPPDPPPPPLPPLPPSPPPVCSSKLEGDSSTELCTPVFCRIRTREQDCEYCKCRGCDFCVEQRTLARVRDTELRSRSPPLPTAVPIATSAAINDGDDTAASMSTQGPVTVFAQRKQKSARQPHVTTGKSSSEERLAGTTSGTPSTGSGIAGSATLLPRDGVGGAELLRLLLDGALYPPQPTGSRDSAFTADLAAALEIDAALLSVRDSTDDGHILLDLLPAHNADLGSLSPSSQLQRLRELVLHASPSSSKALRATIEVQRITRPYGIAEVVLSRLDIAAARTSNKLPVFAIVLASGVIMTGIAATIIILSGGRSGLTAKNRASREVEHSAATRRSRGDHK